MSAVEVQDQSAPAPRAPTIVLGLVVSLISIVAGFVGLRVVKLSPLFGLLMFSVACISFATGALILVGWLLRLRIARILLSKLLSLFCGLALVGGAVFSLVAGLIIPRDSDNQTVFKVLFFGLSGAAMTLGVVSFCKLRSNSAWRAETCQVGDHSGKEVLEQVHGDASNPSPDTLPPLNDEIRRVRATLRPHDPNSGRA